MTFHAQVQCFQTHIGEKRIEWSHWRAKIANPDRQETGYVWMTGKLFGVYQSMITFIRFCEHREFTVRPIKASFFHNYSANAGCMTVDIFCRRMSYNVNAEVKRVA